MLGCWIQIWWLKGVKASENYVITMLQSDLPFPRTVGKGQLPMQFQECGIVDEVPEVAIFENKYFWVTSG